VARLARHTSMRSLEMLQRWGDLGTQLLVLHRGTAPTWEPVSHMIAAASPGMQLANENLRQVFLTSDNLLDPLKDPLFLDFGAHRWLGKEREETYSDWFAWILMQLESPDRILRCVGIESPSTLGIVASDIPRVTREEAISEGHEGHEGRTDIILRFGNTAVVLVELKLTDAKTADLEKQVGYYRWLQEQNMTHRAVLIASGGSCEKYHDFKLVPWASVCRQLRVTAFELMHYDHNLVAAALTLAFVGAIEENVLGLPGNMKSVLGKGVGGWLDRTTRRGIHEHLESWFRAMEERNASA